MKATLCLILSLVSIQLFAQTPKNVVITNGGGKFAPCEPSICVNPANPAEMVAGAVLDYVCYSNDSGKTWETEKLESRYGVYGDPCIVADQKGRFYYFHLSDPTGKGWDDPTILDRIVCQKSKNGRRWNKGFAPNPNGSKDQDKEWAAVHPTEGYIVMTWTEFDHYGSNDSNCNSRILISASKNGKQWTVPITISETNGNCIDDSRTVEGAVPCFSPNG